MLAAATAEMIEMTEMIEALNQQLVVMERESLRRNEERTLEVAAMMAAQAHAYAQSCFMYFQLMAKLSKSQDERNYFMHQ